MKFIAVQNGARRGYAVPEILQRAGMLERFYTDSCGSVGAGRAAKWLRHLPAIGGRIERLDARRLPPSIVSKTHTFDTTALRHAIQTWRLNGDADAAFRHQLERGRSMGQAMVRSGFGSATHIYSMLGEGGPFLAEARRRGLTVVSEIYILLSTLRILAEEREKFPDWEPDTPDDLRLRREQCAKEGLLASSDYFICPSEAVRDDLVANWNVDPSRTAIVPYGMNPQWLESKPKPVRGQILFVGTAELRKGIHYLALAAERLKSQGHDYEFRIAGDVSRQIAARPECRHLTFLGRVPRSRIHEEFELADVFVLPSLAEGSAEATYEALAAGLPVVTTRAAGSVVRHGIDGLIVPERDPVALADAIRQIVDDRPRRDRMAAAAREQARDFTWDRYGERLIAALQTFRLPLPCREGLGAGCV